MNAHTKVGLRKDFDEVMEEVDFENTRSMTFTELEKMTKELCVELQRKLLAWRMGQDPRAHSAEGYVHPACGKKLRIQEESQIRTVRTPAGDIQYERSYGYCDHCNMPYVPFDNLLGIPRAGLSISTRHLVCHASVVASSFEAAADILRVQSGISLSRKHIREVAEEEGEQILHIQKEEIKACEEGKLTLPNAASPELLVVTCDGGRVQTRQEEAAERWKENRIGAVYDAIPKPASHALLGKYDAPEGNIKTYIATMESWDSFGGMLYVEALKRGLESAKMIAFLGDGASAIYELFNMHFKLPNAIFILDWAHAVGHLSDCAKAIFVEDVPREKSWFETHKQLLWDGKLDEIISELQKQSKRFGPPRTGDSDCHPRVVLHRNATSYFPNNKEAMNYPLFRKKGLPIGSGVAEAAVKQFAMRMKSSCKFWNVSDRGANEMLPLCALYQSEDGRWDDYWKRRSKNPNERRSKTTA